MNEAKTAKKKLTFVYSSRSELKTCRLSLRCPSERSWSYWSLDKTTESDISRKKNTGIRIMETHKKRTAKGTSISIDETARRESNQPHLNRICAPSLLHQSEFCHVPWERHISGLWGK